MTVLDHRRENLRRLIEQWQGPGPLASKIGYSNASFLVQMAGPNPTREITEKTARKIEVALGLQNGWLDQAPNQRPQNVVVDVTVLTDVVRLVGQLAADKGITLAPDKLADIVALVYEDAQVNDGLRQAYIERLLNLLR